ncbi:MAG TPA: zinc-binding dehydrogenase [Thermoleophilia bacterium]|nr:zinc-binding dehydrogenase [Thermoleophilia bacterium]
MMAVVTTGNGGLDRLDYRAVPRPAPAAGEVLLRVLAAGVNTTEINTRLGWYSAAVDGSTESTAAAEEERATAKEDGGWSAPTPFPFIQGTDCCGQVVEVGPGGDRNTLERRVLVRPCMRPDGFVSMETVWMGSDFDGAFAQYVRVPTSEVFPVECDWSDAELGSIPCAYGTAENMLGRAGVAEGEHVLVTGASGGVGSAAVQLAKRRGAVVTAVARPAKAGQVAALGADRVIGGRDDIAESLGDKVDVVVDNVGGPAFAGLLGALRRGGRYVTSGAIAGPLVTFDKRTLYLNDLTVIGCTAWDAPVFPSVVAAIERGEIRPRVAATYPLARIAEAQRDFLEKRHVGKFVLIPEAPEE